MSHRRNFQFVLILIAIGALAFPAFSAPPRTAFTGTETPNPPAGGMMIPLGGNVYVLGMTQTAVDETTDPRTTGTNTIVVYGILSQTDGTGPMWGTVSIENADGAWTGSWQGQLTREGDDLISTGQGTTVGSGKYAGLIAFWSLRSVNNAPRQVTGYITKGKVNERPMKFGNDVSIVKVDMNPANWNWLAPNMAVIPWTMESTGVGTHLGEYQATVSGVTLFEFQPDGSMVTLAQCSDGEYVAANGDKLFVFQWPNLEDQTVGYGTIRGGTGRFANANGSWIWTGDITDRWAEGPFRFIRYVGSIEGTITY